MVTTGTIEQTGVQPFLRHTANSDASTTADRETQSAERPAQQTQFQASTFSVRQVFAVRLAARVDHLGVEQRGDDDDHGRSGARNDTPYDSEDSVVPRFLRTVAGFVEAAGSERQQHSIIARARTAVSETSSEVRQLTPDDDPQAEQARASIESGLNTGLDRIEQQAPAPAGESTLTQTAMLQRLRGRLSLGIETQDGDVIRLRLKVSHREGAITESFESADQNSRNSRAFTATDLRFRVDIRGDLDADELAAMQDVIAQVDAIAQGLTGGDFEAALDALSGFSFNSDELSSVNLRMRVREQMQFASRQLTTTPALPAEQPGGNEPTPGGSAPATDTNRLVSGQPVTDSSPTAGQPPVESAPTIPQSPAETGDAAGDSSVLASLAATLHQFMSTTRIGIRIKQDDDGDHGQLRLRFSQHSVTELLETLVRARQTDPETLARADAEADDDDGDHGERDDD